MWDDDRDKEGRMKAYCQCGCGKEIGSARGHGVEGATLRFARGHRGSKVRVKGKLYWLFLKPDHPRATKYVLEHLLIAEQALGKYLPQGAVVHHADGNGFNNYNNLVVCENQAYHKLLHMRTNALKACGNAGWMKCCFCGEYDHPSNMYVYPTGNRAVHTLCRLEYQRAWHKNKRKVA